ncbi:MAG: hypothetical protein K0S00_3078 [Xanthobacteraceae bacterium]|jgi:hypothetical protein|nr:hypothetical protein [Xanthobacteraceae bacterium]
MDDHMKPDLSLAHLEHEHFHNRALEMFRSAISFGLEAIRTAALINGGSVIAGLAFIATLFESDRYIAVQLTLPVFGFAIGAMLSGFASCFAYFSQIFYSDAFNKVSLSYQYPYVDYGTAPAKRRKLAGDIFRALAVLSVALAYAAIVFGTYRAYLILYPS